MTHKMKYNKRIANHIRDKHCSFDYMGETYYYDIFFRKETGDPNVFEIMSHWDIPVGAIKSIPCDHRSSALVARLERQQERIANNDIERTKRTHEKGAPINFNCDPAMAAYTELLAVRQLHEQKSNTMRKYKLLKDLPGVKAGTVYIPEHGLKEGAQRYMTLHFHDNPSLNSIAKSIVENNPDWFQKVIEPMKVTIDGKEYNLQETFGYSFGFVHPIISGVYETFPLKQLKVTRYPTSLVNGTDFMEIIYKSIRIDDKFYALEPIEK